MQGTQGLTREQREQYDEQGFVRLPRFADI